MTNIGESATIYAMKKSVLSIIILSLITLGIYIPIWFLLQSRFINRFSQNSTFDRSLPILALIVAIAPMLMVFSWAYFNIPSEYLLDQIISISNLAFVVIILKMSFAVRRIFIDHYASSEGRVFPISRVATFFFTIYYLQYKMNRLPA